MRWIPYTLLVIMSLVIASGEQATGGRRKNYIKVSKVVNQLS